MRIKCQHASDSFTGPKKTGLEEKHVFTIIILYKDFSWAFAGLVFSSDCGRCERVLILGLFHMATVHRYYCQHVSRWSRIALLFLPIHLKTRGYKNSVAPCRLIFSFTATWSKGWCSQNQISEISDTHSDYPPPNPYDFEPLDFFSLLSGVTFFPRFSQTVLLCRTKWLQRIAAVSNMYYYNGTMCAHYYCVWRQWCHSPPCDHVVKGEHVPLW